jgi:hypothetical protein
MRYSAGQDRIPLKPALGIRANLSIDFSNCSHANLGYSLLADPAAGDVVMRDISGDRHFVKI